MKNGILRTALETTSFSYQFFVRNKTLYMQREGQNLVCGVTTLFFDILLSRIATKQYFLLFFLLFYL
jgi:hypothetical protein